MSIIEHLRDVIAAASPTIATSGGGTGWRLGIGRMLDNPDTQIVLYDAPGEHPSPLWLLDYPYVHVLVRGTHDGYGEARQKAQDVFDTLLGIVPMTFAPSGDRIDGITNVGTPSFIGNDQMNRPVITANYRVIYEPAPSVYTHRQPL